jgi:hypothetical protein
LPRSSNNPPPDEPSETGAVICTYSTPSILRKPDKRPCPSVRSKPLGVPIV